MQLNCREAGETLAAVREILDHMRDAARLKPEAPPVTAAVRPVPEPESAPAPPGC